MCPRTSQAASSFRSGQSRCVTTFWRPGIPRNPARRNGQGQGAGAAQPRPWGRGGTPPPSASGRSPSPPLGLSSHNLGAPPPEQDDVLLRGSRPHCPPPEQRSARLQVRRGAVRLGEGHACRPAQSVSGAPAEPGPGCVRETPLAPRSGDRPPSTRAQRSLAGCGRGPHPCGSPPGPRRCRHPAVLHRRPPAVETQPRPAGRVLRVLRPVGHG